jgi:hypothetical protein
MRVNVYAEEMTDVIEIISKEVDGTVFTGLRFYLYLPVTHADKVQVRGPFIHKPGDDDSSAVTFWGKRDLREVLKLALEKLDEHYSSEGAAHVKDDVPDGWTKNFSIQDICPIPEGSLVDVKFRDGIVWENQHPRNFRWDNTGKSNGDIIAYRLCKNEQKHDVNYG